MKVPEFHKQDFSKFFKTVADDALGKVSAFERTSTVVAAFNSILRKFKRPTLTDRDLIVTRNKLITNHYTGSRKISDAVYDLYFKKAESGLYWHWTSWNAFKEIAANEELLIPNLTKRKGNSQEFVHFTKVHNLDGYLQQDKNGIPKWKSMAMEIYHMCFTKANSKINQNKMWDTFGNKGRGVRITFEIQPHTTDFRRVAYSKRLLKSGLPLLRQLSNEAQKVGRFLVLYQISKIGAFFIQGTYSHQSETRLIIKKGTDDYDFNLALRNFKGSLRAVLPFKSYIATIKIVEVKPGPYRDEKTVSNFILSLPYKIDLLPKSNKASYDKWKLNN